MISQFSPHKFLIISQRSRYHYHCLGNEETAREEWEGMVRTKGQCVGTDATGEREENKNKIVSGKLGE